MPGTHLGRIVEVARDGVHLSVERGFLKLSREGERLGEVALDDIGAVVVHGHGASFSANVCARLADRGAPLVICGPNHAPKAMLWAVGGHHDQGRRMQAQADASLPVRKRLWRDIVKAKITAQVDALERIGSAAPALRQLARTVKSGDPENVEAQAARRYWPLMLGEKFRRDRAASGANALLNYGYTVLRAGAARATLAAGLHPSLALHHVSRGDALRLADDLMEPFRPWVDLTVRRLADAGEIELTPEVKAALAEVMTLDLAGPRGLSPLQACLNRLAVSLAQVFLKERSGLELPGPPLALDGL